MMSTWGQLVGTSSELWPSERNAVNRRQESGMQPIQHPSGASALPRITQAAPDAAGRRTSVDKGLENDGGSNHCFLNVAIQTFWNLSSFRQRFVNAPEHNHDLARPVFPQGWSAGASTSASSSSGSAGYAGAGPQLMCKPCNVNPASGHEELAPADPLDSPESCCFCALKSVFTQYQFSEAEALPPDAVRSTMANTFETSGRFQLGEMEDATETIEALLDILHLSHMYAPKEVEAQNDTDRSRHQLAKVSGADRVEEASNFACQPPCIAHEVFGIEYLDVPVCTFCGASFDPTSISSSFLYRVYVAELLAEQGRPDAAVEREETTKANVYDLSDQVYRLTSRWTNTRPEMQAAMRALCQRRVDKKCTECNSRHTVVSERWLTRRPYTFMVSLVWPTSMPSHEMLWLVVSSIQPSMQMEQVFKTERSSHSKMGRDANELRPAQGTDSSAEKYPLHLFRGLICYYGMHYIAFFWCWARRKWVLFDDTRVREEKDWSSVVRVIMEGQYVPTVLFYENSYDDDMTQEAVEELFRQVRELEDQQNACVVT